MRKIAIAGLGIGVLAAVWSGAWFLAAREAGRQVDAWVAAEQAQGRTWTCPGRAIGGYPTALAITCRRPTFSGAALGQIVQGSLMELTATASLAHPFRIVVSLRPPFRYRSSDGATDVTGEWTRLQVDLYGLPDINRVSLAGAGVVLDGQFGPAGQQHIPSTGLDAQFGLPAAGPDPTLAFDVAVAGTDISAIDALVGDTKPTDLHVVGTLDQTDLGDARTPEDAMDRWRRAGGRLELTMARFAQDGSRVSATGLLQLDAAHRPQGHLQAEFVGVEPILKRYGINTNLAAAGALLSTLFGGAPKQAPSAPGAISLPISLDNGNLVVGPIRTNILVPPLY